MDEPHAPGVVSLPSQLSFTETVARLKEIIGQKGLELFAEIDHHANAMSVGLEMQPAVVLIFGNARAGTPLMIASPRLGLDLPLKVLVWQDGDGSVWASYNSTAYLAQRYGIPDDLTKNIAGIDAIVGAALQR